MPLKSTIEYTLYFTRSTQHSVFKVLCSNGLFGKDYWVFASSIQEGSPRMFE